MAKEYILVLLLLYSFLAATPNGQSNWTMFELFNANYLAPVNDFMIQ